MLIPQPNAILSDLESPLPSLLVSALFDGGLGDDPGELGDASGDSEVD
jgi:hypothetical protein